MKKILSAILLFILLLLKPSSAEAAITLTQDPSPAYANSGQVKFTFTSDKNDFLTNQSYTFNTRLASNPDLRNDKTGAQAKNNSTLEVLWTIPNFKATGDWNYDLYLGKELNDSTRLKSGTFHIYPPSGEGGLPALAMDSNSFQANTNANLYIRNADPSQNYVIWYAGELGFLYNQKFPNQIDSQKTVTLQILVGSPTPNKKVCMTISTPFGGTSAGLNCDFSLTFSVTAGAPNGGGPIQSNEEGTPSPTPPIPPGPCKDGFCLTALGKFSTDPPGFIKSIFSIILSLAGGVAIILIMISGYRLMSSQGNPEKVQAAREQLTSAIVGLLFIIFSVTILQIIGVDILHIPGFTSQ